MPINVAAPLADSVTAILDVTPHRLADHDASAYGALVAKLLELLPCAEVRASRQKLLAVVLVPLDVNAAALQARAKEVRAELEALVWGDGE